MKHKIGDVVIIKHSLKAGETYKNEAGRQTYFADEMEKYMGMIATIKDINDKRGIYKLDIDGSYWSWSESMFKTEQDLLVVFDKGDGTGVNV